MQLYCVMLSVERASDGLWAHIALTGQERDVQVCSCPRVAKAVVEAAKTQQETLIDLCEMEGREALILAIHSGLEWIRSPYSCP